jgi:hypothetical protein
MIPMKKKHQKNNRSHFCSAFKWKDIEQVFIELGADIVEGEGSRIGVRLFGERRVFHRPHPLPDTDKGAVSSIRRWFEMNGVKP